MFRILVGIGESIRVLIGNLAWLTQGNDNHQKKKPDVLASLVLDYVQMRLHTYPEQGTAVDVGELAFRFRERQRDITRALYLLESQGRAEFTEFDGLWEITDSPATLSQPRV